MIRKLQEADINQVMQIWLNGNMEAHTFVAQEYWQSNYDMVQEQLLQAEVFVLEVDGVVQGFIGLVEGYIAGIFVAGQYRSMGVGRQLLDYAKQRYNTLTLSVYQQNERAIAFYRREGFAVSAEGMDEETGSAEYTMTWRAQQDNAIQAVYVHIPFCLKKCNYCDFLSFAQPTQMEAYVQALAAEMALSAARYTVRAKTIFIGGGTPSCLPEPLLEQVLQAVQQYFVTDDLQEYTVEANPGTLTEEKLRLMKQYGVNRLSFGVQSDNARQLQMLGRIHTFAQAQEAVQMARDAGFTNINLDFMYGLPGQTLAQWRHTLKAAIALHPQHLSLYQLKIEEGTQMAQWLEQGKIEEFDDELALQMYRTSQQMLAEAGYEQYEISNYAQPGYSSAHNQVYWRTDNYLAVGLGACSWVRPLRWNNSFTMADYLAQVQAGRLPQQEPEHLTEQEQMEETVFMALRMNQGLYKVTFQQRFGKPIEAVFADALQRCISQGWLEEACGYLRLTEVGRVLGNVVFLEFIQ